MPASVVLGYAKMDPLQWATLASHSPATIRPEMLLGSQRFLAGGFGLSAAASRAGWGAASGEGGGPAGGPAQQQQQQQQRDGGLLPAPRW